MICGRRVCVACMCGRCARVGVRVREYVLSLRVDRRIAMSMLEDSREQQLVIRLRVSTKLEERSPAHAAQDTKQRPQNQSLPSE